MSGSSQPDYYKALGLPPSATPEEIKKRYRELARRYHPDVNPSPEATQKIKVINEAYHTLGDSDRRAVYDADHFLNRRKPSPSPGSAERPSASASSPKSSAGTSRPPFTSERVEFNGFGRAPAEPPRAQTTRATTSYPSGSREGTERRATNSFGTVERLVAEAQLAFINRRYREAEDLCHQVLMIDARNAIAHEVLGDVCLKRGQKSSAATAYSYAIQYNPHNFSVQTKLERLLGRRENPNAGPKMTRPVTKPSWERLVDGPYRDTKLALLNVLLLAMFGGVLAMFFLNPGEPLYPTELSINALVALLMEGVIAGILLAFNGGMRPIAEELLTREVKPDNRVVPVSLGAILVLFALFWFYFSLLVFMLIGMSRSRLSLSVLRVYGLTLLLIVVFAMLYRPEGSVQVALWSGNLLFPAMLLGWAMGDSIRLRGR